LTEVLYHVELRQFPHNMCRFNLSAQELRSVVLEPWAQDRWVEFGERKWSPHQAKLTVLEGPRIPFGQLTMGRGWRTAEREGREVTAELLAVLERELASGPGPTHAPGGASGAAAGAAHGPDGAAADAHGSGGSMAAAPRPDGSQLGEGAGDPADSLGLELLSRIGTEAAPLQLAWELAGERHPGSPASATLALAERALESLLRARLIVLLRAAGEEPDGGGEQPARDPRPAEADLRPLVEDELARAIGEIASWHGAGAPGAVWIRRV
jgi:hypothetical protein